jgi:hypothetical protein
VASVVDTHYFDSPQGEDALTLQIYRKDLKLGELQIGRGSVFWVGARRQSGKRIHLGRFAEMMDG